MLNESHEDRDALDALNYLQIAVGKLPDPKPGDKNKRHFILQDGSVVLKSVPWLDRETGEQNREEPPWYPFFSRTAVVSKADYLENLEDGDENSICCPIGYYSRAFVVSRRFQNPLTGEVVVKWLPWVDDEDNAIVLSEYISGLELSEGRQIVFDSNSDYVFEDPMDKDNLRFFNWDAMDARVISGVFGEIGWRKEKEAALADEYVGVIGVNFGGTVMMEETAEGLVPAGMIQFRFKDHLQKDFPKCSTLSFALPKTKTTRGSECSHGVDSSQLEIDFIADTAIAMTCIWNELTPKERREFAGFVLSVGTDSSVETMAILKTMLGPDCPFSVVGFGSMLPMGEKESDALENFRAAYDDLITLRERGLKVVGMRMEGGLYDPLKTRKVSDTLGPSFQGYKYIDSTAQERAGTVNAERFLNVEDSDFESPFESTKAFRGIDEVKYMKSKVSSGPFRLEQEVADSEHQAILVAVYPSFTQAMNDLEYIKKGAKGRPVFYVNQVLGGSIDQAYAVAKELKKHGIHPVAMTEEAATAKINLAVRLFGNDHRKIVDFVTKNNYVGEQSEGFTVENDERDLKYLRNMLFELVVEDAEELERFGRGEVEIGVLSSSVTTQVADLGMAAEAGIEPSAIERFKMYKNIQSTEPEALFHLVQIDYQGLGSRLQAVEPVLFKNLQNGIVSTVRPQGHPIDLTYNSQTPAELPASRRPEEGA
jgi:L-asparaginase/Glu-tRNA(Gln) amidotransferase subunit D